MTELDTGLFNTEGGRGGTFSVIGAQAFLDFVNRSKRSVFGFVEEVKNDPFRNSIDDYLKSSDPKKREKA